MTSAVIDAGDGLPLTIGALLHERASGRGDHTLITVDDDSLTYAAAVDRSAELAKGLLAAGLGLGSRVAILHPNGPDFVVAWLAAARIGAVSVPLSTFSTTSELVGLLRGADVTLLLSAPSYRSHDYVTRLGDGLPGCDLVSSAPLFSVDAPSLRRVVFDVDELVASGAGVTDDALAAAEAAVTSADAMVVVHTSGSTSEPKGVLHAHGALIRHLDNLNELRRYDQDEILFANSPFFWIGGFAYALLGTLVAGAHLVCSNATTAAGVLDVLERERPTMVNGFAASIAHLPADPSFTARDLSSIRCGNLYPIMPAAIRPADPELRHSMLGMTEAGSVCIASADESDQPEYRRGSFGRPVPGFEVRLIDPDVTPDSPPSGFRSYFPPSPGGKYDQNVGGSGELCFRGPFLMEGYLGRERHETFDADGWYRTGDLVMIDEDGFVYFRGRAGDMIKTAGANVSPREVEAAILDATGLVSHVVGLDDADRGQIVAALLVVPPGSPDVDLDALRAQLKERVSAYKVPKRFVVVAPDDVPIMSSGKLDLRALKDVLAHG